MTPFDVLAVLDAAAPGAAVWLIRAGQVRVGRESPAAEARRREGRK